MSRESGTVAFPWTTYALSYNITPADFEEEEHNMTKGRPFNSDDVNAFMTEYAKPDYGILPIAKARAWNTVFPLGLAVERPPQRTTPVKPEEIDTASDLIENLITLFPYASARDYRQVQRFFRQDNSGTYDEQRARSINRGMGLSKPSLVSIDEANVLTERLIDTCDLRRRREIAEDFLRDKMAAEKND